jgi:hypothetical protein
MLGVLDTFKDYSKSHNSIFNSSLMVFLSVRHFKSFHLDIHLKYPPPIRRLTTHPSAVSFWHAQVQPTAPVAPVHERLAHLYHLIRLLCINRALLWNTPQLSSDLKDYSFWGLRRRDLVKDNWLPYSNIWKFTTIHLLIFEVMTLEVTP